MRYEKILVITNTDPDLLRMLNSHLRTSVIPSDIADPPSTDDFDALAVLGGGEDVDI